MLIKSIDRCAVSRNRRTSDGGFTLLELLVVLGIIALLATFTGPVVLGYLGQARSDTARAQVAAISTALELYALDNGTMPAQEMGLSALVSAPQNGGTWHGPYLKRKEGLIDPWGRPYNYKFPANNGRAEVYTLGRDNAPGGTAENQDITNN
jgi:general secretion pathway protein G